MRFINRKKDIKYLEKYFENIPNNILFVYGPKSSGKSTLLNKVIENLDKDKFVINAMDLRGVLIYNFKTFIDVFFQERDVKSKITGILSGLTINAGFFTVSIDDEKMLKKNAFKIMERQIIESNSKGIKPIIIIDEIQDIKSIYIDQDRMLINELFSLFIRLTKVLHSAHIVLATSDSYFIEEIYNNAKLRETTDLYFVDHFDYSSVKEWLEKENFTEAEIKMVYDKIGGSPWAITELLNYMKHGQTIEEVCEKFINLSYGQVAEFLSKIYDEDEEKVCLKVIREIAKKTYCKKTEIKNKKIISELIIKMVDNDFWFYRVDKQEITANNRRLELAFKRF
jgi:AAA+ ATPase superfamily predicted ATPase